MPRSGTPPANPGDRPGEAHRVFQAPAPGEGRQLRLAIVLYGGVSLAIYMHGSTKELHKLVRASALLEQSQGSEDMDEGAAPVERVYLRLLDERRRLDEVPTRVVVDIVSGTSAGGINGVYLAKAVAHDQSQDALRDLWLVEGDINRLLWGPRWLPGWLKRAIAVLRAPRRPVLVGDRMSKQLMEALERMDAGVSGSSSLMPVGQELELFVTATDFWGSPRQVLIDDPVQVADRAHRAVLRFRYEQGGGDEFSPRHNPVLAFAGRATSCFPGAFPPVRFWDFRSLVGTPGSRLSDLVPEFARAYELAGVDPAGVWFIDGGVLDNRPFGHAIGAIRGRPAGTEVDRRLVYLEPDPPSDDRMPRSDRPGQLATVLGALAGIPRHEPILADLLELARLNERVWRLRRVIETNFDAIVARVEALPGLDLDDPAAVGPERLAEWRERLDAEASGGSAGLGYATYIRLRISAAVDRYADLARDLGRFPERSGHAQLVRAVFRYWVGDQLGLLVADDDRPEARAEFLRRFDLDYVERLLSFLIAGLNWFYRDLADEKTHTPSREQLDRAKRLLYGRRADIARATRPDQVPTAVTRAVTQAFPDAAVKTFLREEGLAAPAYSRTNGETLKRLDETLRVHVDRTLSGTARAIYELVLEATDRWPPKPRRRFLVRYLGFPLWDPILFPIQSLAEAGERDQIEVQRWSPGGRRLLGWEGPGPKLVGSTHGHFGAFMDRTGRERDYLWGRLDAAESLVRLLFPGRDAAARAAQDERFTEVARAILDEEEPHLVFARSLIDDLRSRLG